MTEDDRIWIWWMIIGIAGMLMLLNVGSVYLYLASSIIFVLLVIRYLWNTYKREKKL